MIPDATDSPIVFRYEDALRLRVAEFHGVVTDESMGGAYAALLSAPDYDPTADDLVDLRGVTHLGVSPDGLRAIMDLFSPIDELGIATRLAIVAPTDAVYGVSRMYEMLRGDGVPEEIRVFRDMTAAHAWLADGREARGHAGRTSAA